MTELEIIEMQNLIDKGIVLAQSRLVQRACKSEFPLVVFRDGKVMEIDASELRNNFR